MLDINDYDFSSSDSKLGLTGESGQKAIYLENNFNKRRGTSVKKHRKNNSNYTKPKKRK